MRKLTLSMTAAALVLGTLAIPANAQTQSLAASLRRYGGCAGFMAATSTVSATWTVSRVSRGGGPWVPPT
jgi:hypothetical protein